MNHLCIVLSLLVTLIIFDVSQGQRCLADYHCARNRCCVIYRNWNEGSCMLRYYYSAWCSSVRRCSTNRNCYNGECCRLFSPGVGQCEPNPPGTTGSSLYCPRPCQDKNDCGRYECCRMTSSGQGECVHYGDVGQACSTGSSTGIVDMCPCDLGLDCKANAGSTTSSRGVCQSHASGCTSHTECKQQRPGTCCKSVGGSQRMCVTAVDAYGKC